MVLYSFFCNPFLSSGISTETPRLYYTKHYIRTVVAVKGLELHEEKNAEEKT